MKANEHDRGPRRASRLGVAALVLIALWLGWTLRGAAPASTGAPDAAEAEDASELWTCAMHPQIQLDRPGECPLCGMDLIPVPRHAEGRDAMDASITIRREGVARMRVETRPVERRFVDAPVRMVGKITYDETRLADLTAWVPGRLDRLYVDYTGVTVTQGDHMVLLYSPELYGAQEELLTSLRAVGRREQEQGEVLGAIAERTLDASRERLGQWGLTPAQIREIEARGTPSHRMTIFAPVGGVVVQKHAQQGMYVQEGSRIYTIADLSSLWVQLDAYESDLVWLHYGQRVDFTTQAYPGETFVGTVAFISPELDPATRTVKVRVNVDNSEGRLKPEMFVRALVRTRVAAGGRVMDPDLAGRWICPMHPEIVREAETECDLCGMDLVPTESLGYVAAREDDDAKPLVVPARAPLITGERAVVYVQRPGSGDLTFEGREVVLGPRAGEWYIVKQGLHEGELVVTDGNFLIDSALEIQARPSMMLPEGGGAATHEHGPPDHGSDEEQNDG